MLWAHLSKSETLMGFPLKSCMLRLRKSITGSGLRLSLTPVRSHAREELSEPGYNMPRRRFGPHVRLCVNRRETCPGDMGSLSQALSEHGRRLRNIAMGAGAGVERVWGPGKKCGLAHVNGPLVRFVPWPEIAFDFGCRTFAAKACNVMWLQVIITSFCGDISE